MSVQTVPESFEYEAVHEGRAPERARRNVSCDRQYLPLFTGFRLAYLCEVFRIGYQFEQRALSCFRFRLYVWGGGLAIRRELEDRITQDRHPVTEDTAFSSPSR